MQVCGTISNGISSLMKQPMHIMFYCLREKGVILYMHGFYMEHAITRQQMGLHIPDLFLMLLLVQASMQVCC